MVIRANGPLGIPNNQPPYHERERQQIVKLLLGGEHRCSFIGELIMGLVEAKRPRVSSYSLTPFLRIFWYCSGVFHYELLEKGLTMISEFFCRKSNQVAQQNCSQFDSTRESYRSMLVRTRQIS